MADAGIIEIAVKAVLPDVLDEAELLALKFANAADNAIEQLMKRGTLTIETSAPITIIGHKGPHPDDT